MQRQGTEGMARGGCGGEGKTWGGGGAGWIGKMGGEAPAEPMIVGNSRLGRSLALPRIILPCATTEIRDCTRSIEESMYDATDAGKSTKLRRVVILRPVMIERIGERHASACRYKKDVPEGSRRSARQTHFWPREV